MSLWRRLGALFNQGRLYQGRDQFGNLYYEKAAEYGINSSSLFSNSVSSFLSD